MEIVSYRLFPICPPAQRLSVSQVGLCSMEIFTTCSLFSIPSPVDRLAASLEGSSA
jgi:hypothetical protein